MDISSFAIHIYDLLQVEKLIYTDSYIYCYLCSTAGENMGDYHNSDKTETHYHIDL